MAYKPSPIMRYFDTAHLQHDDLRKVSIQCGVTADLMDLWLPDSAEKSAGLRKLLEAKDCFVRAALDGVRE